MRISLKVAQGTNLMRFVADLKFPQALGKKEYSPNVRATFNHELRQLWKALRRASPIYEEERVSCFGPRESWQLIKTQGPDGSKEENWEPVDGAPKAELELTGQARNGLYRVLLLWLHPESRWQLGIARQDEAAWDIAEQIKATRSLEEEIGLAAKETVAISYDDAEPAAAQ